MKGVDDLSAEIRMRLGDIKGCTVTYDAEFGSKTTYRVGGQCLAMINCQNVSSLAQILDVIAPRPLYVLGNGSNTLVSDNGWDGVVLSLTSEFERIDLSADGATLGAAVSLPTAARQFAKNGLGGMEWAVGIPGTVGGAVKMNAGGHGSDTAAWIEGATVYRFSEGGYRLERASSSELGLSYRASNIGERDVVASASFHLVACDQEQSKRLISQIVRWRRDHQPGGQNAGSVFANPENDHAARLIELGGLKGYRFNSAEVSTKHANFIQAASGGSAGDVFELIWLVQQLIERELGIRLRTEIKLLGFDRERSLYLNGE